MSDALDKMAAEVLANKDDCICGDPHDIYYLACALHQALKESEAENVCLRGAQPSLLMEALMPTPAPPPNTGGRLR